MKIIFLELLKGLLLGVCFVLFCLILATCSRSAYAVDLSKNISVTPQRIVTGKQIGRAHV